ncbi:biotin-[acetyl-CoA-carboxylase] ligase [Batrachochytrium salamandrivorans]|nr:biotin-[acetyl-CoA-carboxylase] ligase [Batrachochytrium salamandrivorans]
MSKLNVLVYNGPGVSNLQRPLLQQLRQQLSQSYDIITVDAHTLATAPWAASTALLVVPGGRDLAYMAALDPAGTAAIRRYMHGENDPTNTKPNTTAGTEKDSTINRSACAKASSTPTGGRYLGICAGAYFACAAVEFELGRHDYEVIGPRPLRFCPAVAVGSVTAPIRFEYNSEMSAAAMEIVMVDAAVVAKDLTTSNTAVGDVATPTANVNANTTVDTNSVNTMHRSALSSDKLVVYVNGGPYFDLSRHCSFDHESLDQSCCSTTVVARYATNGMPAIVDCCVGSPRSTSTNASTNDNEALGKAILVGPHLEVSASYVRDHISIITDDAERAHLQELLPALDQFSTADTNTNTLDIRPTPIQAYFVSDVQHSRFMNLMRCDDGSNEIVDTHNTWNVSTTSDYQQMPVVTDSLGDVLSTGTLKLCSFSMNNTINETILDQKFNASSYFNELNLRREQRMELGSASFGTPLLYSQVITSTQTVLEKNMKLRNALEDGAVMVGSHQLCGRGRNSWISQKGCLQFSFKMSHKETASVVLLQYLFGLSVVMAVQSLPNCEKLPVRLKWPNDIYAQTQDGPRKIGGVLITSEYHNGSFSLIVGCGLNVSNRKPTLCVNDLVRDAGVVDGYTVSHEALLAAIMHTFGCMYATFMGEVGSYVQGSRFEPFLPMYYNFWLHRDQKVRILEHGLAKEAKIIGLSKSGLLRARMVSDESERLLQPDGNSFDMLKGLLFSKE